MSNRKDKYRFPDSANKPKYVPDFVTANSVYMDYCLSKKIKPRRSECAKVSKAIASTYAKTGNELPKRVLTHEGMRPVTVFLYPYKFRLTMLNEISKVMKGAEVKESEMDALGYIAEKIREGRLTNEM